MRDGCAGGGTHALPLKKLIDGANSVTADVEEEKGLPAGR